jgi:FAD/FMN-containing dehydrogenase
MNKTPVGGLTRLFEHFHTEHVTSPLYDYGKLYKSEDTYVETIPSSVDEAHDVVRLASEHATPLRVRASGHTFSGATLPRSDELLLRTDRLDHYRFDELGSVTVGCGALVWDIRDLVRDHGFDLPVYNGGWAGPTLGGYINAGGFGKSGLSEREGGLWENVFEVVLVDGTGQRRTVRRDEAEFPWIFGSFGQLGLYLEAKLRLIPAREGPKNRTYPCGVTGNVPKRQEDNPRVNDVAPPAAGQESLFWFSVLTSPQYLPQAWRGLIEWVIAHPGLVVPEGGWVGPTLNGEPIGYQYIIRFGEFNPPLVFPRAETFLVIGIMSTMRTGTSDDNARVLAVEQAFVETMLDRQLHLYLQAENIGGRVDLRNYYGADTYRRFLSLKRAWDPSNILNRDVVFKPNEV